MLLILKRNVSVYMNLNVFLYIWNFLISSNIVLIMGIYTLFHLFLILSVTQGSNNPFFILADYLIK